MESQIQSRIIANRYDMICTKRYSSSFLDVRFFGIGFAVFVTFTSLELTLGFSYSILMCFLREDKDVL
jgi:hypothetical protein